jgi:Xylose isomerase-like TIM barrel
MTEARNLWAHDNLLAWCVVPFDAKKRGPEERAEMLARLGFKHFAYDWRDEHIPTFEEEIQALKRHGVNLLAWMFLGVDPDNPLAKTTLEIFKRQDVRPQLWVMQSSRDLPSSEEAWLEWMPDGEIPTDLVEKEKAFFKAFERFSESNMPRTPEEQAQRVDREADRIQELIELAAPYGCKVELYNHNGWFGIIENEVAIVERLHERGVTNVGLVYNFSHLRDHLHDDTVDFPVLWETMKPYVDVVNIAGTHFEDGTTLLPGDGDSELEMMRTIQESGWVGPIGLIGEGGDDVEIRLRNCIAGLDLLAAELAAAPALDRETL